MKIVCLGDSLTYGYGVPRRDVWVTLSSVGEWELVNKGVNGDTTGGMLARFTADVTPCRPDAALLMGGANDRFFSGTFGAAKANLMALAHRCCAEGIVPILGIPIPLCPPVREGWAELIDSSFYDEYDAYCAELLHMASVFGFAAVNFRSAFVAAAAACGEPLSSFYLSDGLHPNARGHRIMADILSDALPKLL